MKGAKPKSNALRRGQADMFGLQIAEDTQGVTIPEDIEQDPVQSKIWMWLAPPSNNFAAQDVPTLRLLTYWHAVAMQAEQAMKSENGKINIFDAIGVKPFKSPDGKEIPLVKKSPALTILKEASTEIRALSDMLGLSPLARTRIGLMDATATKTAADTAKIFQSIDAAYSLPATEVEVEKN